ncbi:MAG: phosphonate metabolism protein/1,5-bisphosphokinase (PRPP-forming) PhnN [Candidatus Hodarchaeales archaeon]|jgi:phosphonate metabolism protein PhnN/1,5-bisphosphokinase (PRPP-forming)
MTIKFPGTLFLVIGNSGSGKDSIISGVVNEYPSNLTEIFSPKRYITRPSSEFEENITVTKQDFETMEKNGKFALTWHIYNLNYGIPIEIEKWLKKGHPVIINVSRTIVKEARKKYANVKVIFIEVPLEITVQRLKSRNRESRELVKKRIERANNNLKFSGADFIVDNSGDLMDAVAVCLNYLVKVVS